jgi:hypothetical protein
VEREDRVKKPSDRVGFRHFIYALADFRSRATEEIGCCLDREAAGDPPPDIAVIAAELDDCRRRNASSAASAIPSRISAAFRLPSRYARAAVT